MIISKVKREQLASEFRRRASEIQVVFNGAQATNINRFHGMKGRGEWAQQTLDKSLIVDTLKLRLAISDLETMLKELKQLTK
jgi:hypothetical protein